VTNVPDDRWMAGQAYEAYMGRWSRLVAHEFVRWVCPERSAHWLDVGCGTGALTSAICDLCEPASVTACDPSEGFIEHARRNITDVRVRFLIAGAEVLPRRNGGFDAAVSGLVLNFLPHPGEAVASLRDRVRAGGIVACYVWDYSDGMKFLTSFWEEAVALNPRAAALDECTRFPICRVTALDALLRAEGLVQVETRAIDIPTSFSTFEDYWTPFLLGTGPAPSYVASLNLPMRESLKERLRRRLPIKNDGSIELQARAWAVRGLVR